MLFRKKHDYQSERAFNKQSYIRWRGQLWFRITYAIVMTLVLTAAVLYAAVIANTVWIVIRALGGMLTQANQTYTWSPISGETLLNLLLVNGNPSNTFQVWVNAGLPIKLGMLLLWLYLMYRFVGRRVYDWSQVFGDITRNTNRFATIEEIEQTYKLVPDRNKFYQGAPGHPVAHISGYDRRFATIHPILFLWQWLKRPLGMNERVWPTRYIKLRTWLQNMTNKISWLHHYFMHQQTVKGGFEGFYWIDTSNTHAMTSGISRSGKDQMLGYPLIDIIRRSEEQWNIVDTDAKNEDAKMSYKALREAGYDVRMINIMDPSESDSWNPLQIALDYAMQGNLPQAAIEINSIVQIIGNTDNANGNGKDIWDSAAESTIQAIMLVLLKLALEEDNPRLVTLPNTVQFINSMSAFTDKEGDGLTKYFSMIKQLPMTPINNMILLNAGQYLGSSGDTKTSILFTVLNRLTLFADENIARLTSLNTITLTDIGFPRMIKLSFDKRYAGAAVTLRVLDQYHHEVEQIRADIDQQTGEDKLKVNQYGGIQIPIRRFLDNEWLIEASFDNPTNPQHIRRDKVKITGTKRQQVKLGKPKFDRYSKKPVLKVVVESIETKLKYGQVEVSIRYSERPMAIFVITPQDNDLFAMLASLFIAQVYSANTNIASRITQRELNKWIFYKLNEFSMYPRIPGFNNILTRGLTYHQLVDIYIQTIDQPRLHYSEYETQEIIGNTGNWFHVLTNDERTNEALSKKLGEIEVQTESITSQVGVEEKDWVSGNRQVHVEKRRLMDAKELSELMDNELISIRTVKRQDRKFNKVRAFPIFATGSLTLPFAFKLLGDQFTLKYYTADLALSAKHNQLSYQDLYQDFTPYYQLLADQIQTDSGDLYHDTSGQLSAPDNQMIQEQIALARSAHATELTPLQKQEEEAYLAWKEAFVADDTPFLTQEDIVDKKKRKTVEQMIKQNFPRSKNEKQKPAYAQLNNDTFFDNYANNTNRMIIELLGGDLKAMWEIVRIL
ncbi:type IV secretory system conjugative DNA transfer family protein [Leuconostoc pseudomesenteroides]|uniref:type IV secretory system conjugative DNA transfer family protein n=1 Tax=Leuconostoc pseudomesenteroides TaxID=33968 RepID=UPI0039EA4D9A